MLSSRRLGFSTSASVRRRMRGSMRRRRQARPGCGKTPEIDGSSGPPPTSASPRDLIIWSARPLTAPFARRTLACLWERSGEGGHMRSSYLRLGWGTFMVVFSGVALLVSLVMIAGLTAGQQPAGAPAIDADD